MLKGSGISKVGNGSQVWEQFRGDISLPSTKCVEGRSVSVCVLVFTVAGCIQSCPSVGSP